MLRKISKNIRRRIAKTLAAAFAIDFPLSASAMETVPIYWGGKQLFDVQYYGTNDKNDLPLTQKVFNDATFRNNYRAATSKALTLNDAFIFDDRNELTGRAGRIGAYFVGDNVLEVLDGKTFTRLDGVQVSGIPTNLWEGSPRDPELGHSELARSSMSHQLYRSYNNFLEAELALLQDIGYDIDMKNFYGRSIYVGGYNSSTMGVGLRGDIWTNGYGAAGISVDGINDTILVPRGTVEYRGSYLCYTRDINDWDGKLISAKNRGFLEITHRNDDYSITDLVNSDINAPMGSLTVNGKLKSKDGSAIYIAEESFVDRIDINKGAEILGDINSVWKQFDEEEYGLHNTTQTVTYQEAKRDNLGNITGFVNAADGEIFYNGNINGYDNMKMNVTSGTLYYGGAAKFVNDMLPGETTSILATTNVMGNLRNAATAIPVSGMLSNTGAIVGNTIQTTAHAANNLSNLNATQAESYDAATKMNANLIGDTRRKRIRKRLDVRRRILFAKGQSQLRFNRRHCSCARSGNTLFFGKVN